MREPEAKWRKVFFKISNSIYMEHTVIFMISANTLALGIKWIGQPPFVETLTTGLNHGFTIFFLLEAIIKIIGFGYRYFKDRWNVFDFFLAITSIVMILTNTYL